MAQATTDGTTMTSDERAEAARRLVERCGYAAAAVTVLPIPGSELVAVMPIHVGMVVRVGEVYGVDVDRDSATHLILRIGATVGLSLLGSRVAATVGKTLLPFLGGLVSAPFMYASTIAIGRIAECYFARGGLGDDEMRAIYRDTLKKAKRSFDPRRARSGEARAMARQAAQGGADAAPAEPGDADARLERLARLHREGLIDDADLAEGKRRILGDL